MDNGIFGLAMYGALKRDDTNYIETKKGRVTLEDLVKFYEEHVEEKDERKSEKETEKKSVKRTKKRKDRKGSTEVRTSDT